VHVQGWHTFVAPTAMAAAIRHKLPFVLTFHSGGHSSSSRNAIRGIQTRILRPLARRARQLIGVSRFEAEHFSEHLAIPLERFKVIGNGAQMPVPRVKRGSSASGRLILSVGRLERYKGHHRVIEALPEVLKHLPDVRLRVAGDGPYEDELRALVRRLQLEDKVEIGKIPPSQRDMMADVMSEAALVTLISEYEAHPVAVMEAVSLGTPVLTTDTSGFIELAEAGLVHAVPLKASTSALAEAIVRGVNAPARAVALSLPNWEDCTSELLLTYDEVLASVA
jgi:glycosyltransferase involved in cell wall biosynthesis